MKEQIQKAIYKRNRIEALLFGLPLTLIGTTALTLYATTALKTIRIFQTHEIIVFILLSALPFAFSTGAWFFILVSDERGSGILMGVLSAVTAVPVACFYCRQSEYFVNVLLPELRSEIAPLQNTLFWIAVSVLLALLFLYLRMQYLVARALKENKRTAGQEDRSGEKHQREDYYRENCHGFRYDTSIIEARRFYHLPEHFSRRQLNTRRRELSKRFHPDQKGGSEEMMKTVNVFYEILIREAS